ncbi:MAG: tetratricopeptide repeat protein, partial [Desulfatirhabdiaceae bacterium]
LSQQAKSHLLTAAKLNPFDPETVYALALTETRLEQLFPGIFPQRRYNPFNPLPLYREAIRRYPNSRPYHLAMARYLYARHHPEEMIAEVQTLARINPDGAASLMQEPFWSPSIRDAVKNGLEQAIATNINPRMAHQQLAALLENEKDWAGALAQYRRMLQLPAGRNTAGEYFHLGQLYWKNDQRKEAEFCFFKSLDTSPDRDGQILALFNQDQQYDAASLLDFYNQVNIRYPVSARMELALIRSLIALKHFNLAGDLLQQSLNRREPSAETFYLISLIAENQKDWERMEPAIQKATVLDPLNMQYRRIFVNLLKQIGKLTSAEQELDNIIAMTSPATSPLYQERAQMRFNRKDYSGANSDWEEALRFTPNQANLLAQIADSHYKQGNLNQAIFFYRKASVADPQNPRYQQKIRDLSGG